MFASKFHWPLEENVQTRPARQASRLADARADVADLSISFTYLSA